MNGLSKGKKMKEIQFQKLQQEALLPTRAHEGDAGLDLYCVEDVSLEPGEGKIARTGVACAIEPGFYGQIADRSSLGKKGLKTAGGVIDASYRGEIGVILWNISSQPFLLKKGERLAQLIILPIATPRPVEVKELSTTLRGEGGFGSTGR